MRYLLLNSVRVRRLFLNLITCVAICACISGCSSAYKSLSVSQADAACLQKFKPVLSSALYNTKVNVVGRHLSGLLLFKMMPDSSQRVVFSSEMGVKFFDFEFSKDGGFRVYQVMKQLNKKSVLKTLRSDFELVLMRDVAPGKAVVKTDSINTWFGFAGNNETHYYIVNRSCDSLVRIENAMKRKPKVQVIMHNYNNGVPDTIGISHRNFSFEIGLKHIRR
jgi:hypothetical protein